MMESVVVRTGVTPPPNPPAQLLPTHVLGGRNGLKQPEQPSLETTTPNPTNSLKGRSPGSKGKGEGWRRRRPDRWHLATLLSLLIASASLAFTLHIILGGQTGKEFIRTYAFYIQEEESH
jgi:hypothetical protein